MADSLDQQIIDKVVARMQTILTTNGYNTSIGTTVRDSEVNWDQGELPAISVFEGTTTVEPNPDNLSKCVRLMPVIVKVAFERKDTSSDDAKFARHCIQDIHKAVGTDPTFDALVLKTRPKTHGIEYADAQNLEITGVMVELEIAYLAQKFDISTR